MNIRLILTAAAFAFVCAGAAHAQGNVDGVYRAPQGGAGGNSACGTTRFGYPLRVSRGVASLQSVSQGELTGPVGADGSVRIENGRAVVAGKIAGDQFTGSFTVGRCSFALNYTKG